MKKRNSVATQLIHIRIPKDILARIKAQAAAESEAVVTIIRRILRDAVEQER